MESASNALKLESRNKKKSWQELRLVVRSVRRKLSQLSTKVPTGFSFRHSQEEGLASTRLYFLSTLASGRETTLLYTDILHLESVESGEPVTFSWKPLLESSFQVLHPLGRFSREEQLQWERKRMVMWGITAYDYHQVKGRFVFPACGSIFYCDDSDGKSPPFLPQEIKTGSTGARLNPQMCPYNPDLICYVFNGDLWLYNIETNSEVRLTFAKSGTGNLSSEPFSAGIPSYVTQEEFNRYSGFWWQPRVSKGSNTYHILYEEVDESDVDVLHLPSFSEDKGFEDFRFPRAGTSNAHSTLKMLQFKMNPNGQMGEVTRLQLIEPLQSLYPGMEYVVRAGWILDGQNIWAQLLGRSQNFLQLVLIPLHQFVPSDHMLDLTTNHISDSLVMQVIYEESSSAWINVTDVLHFFPQTKPKELSFLWASEESGFRHLYFITIHLLTEHSIDYTKYNALKRLEACLGNRVIKKVALTAGAWEVSEKDVVVDEERRLVFFIGLKDTPLERHLYVVSLDEPCITQRLTPLGFSHSISLDKECSMFVSIQSNITQTPFCQLYLLQHSGCRAVDLKTHLLGCVLEPTESKNVSYCLTSESSPENPECEAEIHQPEVFSHQLHTGHLVYGMIFKPVHMEAGKKYPIVLTIYGGPEVQLVTNTFKGMIHLRQHLLASEGYVVVAIDCRGSRHRGISFESHIQGRMGTVEISDQIEVLQWLSENTGYIDLERVAIHGWSYGGYLSLMGLAQRSDFFKVAVAGAPVTSWNLYDTGYTERYMGTPQANPLGYSSGSVLSYINQFPNEENRLLIIHGMKDENVHFMHTSQLINALVKAGKPYQLQVYPSERHSLRHLDSSEHHEVTLLSFLQQHL